MLRLRLHPLHGGRAETGPVRLDGNASLEFLPLASGRPAEGCEVRLDRLEANRAKPLWTGPPQSVDAAAAGAEEPLAFLGRSVRVPLDTSRRRSVGLRWSTNERCGQQPIGIAKLRLEPKPPAPRPLPSVLLICSDSHRYDRALGATGARLMPHLQELARRSVVYTHAYSNASWTLPSIVSTLTGVFPRYHGAGRRLESAERSELQRRREVPVGQFRAASGENYYFFLAYPHQLLTVGERLRKFGYATAAVVSNYLYISSGLLSDGFDLVIDLHAVPGDSVNRPAFALLEELGPDRPLLLLVHYMDVHQYRFAKARSQPKPDDSAAGREQLVSRYEAMARITDRNLGALLEAWDRAMGSRESLVAFYADHGEHLRDELTGHGNSMDEVLLRVPLVVRYPPSLSVPPGEDASPVSLVDLVPTLLDAVGLPTQDRSLHGASLLRLEGAASVDERPIFADYQLTGKELSSVRAGRHKLLLNVAAGTRELVDTGRVAPGTPEAQARVTDPVAEGRLVRAFREYTRRAEASASGLKSEQVVDQTELEERLRELGYVE